MNKDTKNVIGDIVGKDTKNVIAAYLIEMEMMKILEAETSTASWAAIDKTKLPAKCFMWIEDPDKKSTWHLQNRKLKPGPGLSGCL